jgi:hypothetical protein
VHPAREPADEPVGLPIARAQLKDPIAALRRFARPLRALDDDEVLGLLLDAAAGPWREGRIELDSKGRFFGR